MRPLGRLALNGHFQTVADLQMRLELQQDLPAASRRTRS
jgi:hypothetical protein